MTFDEYQLAAEQTALFQHEFYPAASLMVESAELADLFCKPVLRGDPLMPCRNKVVAEAGDVLWNLAVLLKREGIKLSEVADYNVAKLKSRQSRGVLQGSGGDR